MKIAKRFVLYLCIALSRRQYIQLFEIEFDRIEKKIIHRATANNNKLNEHHILFGQIIH